MEILQKLPASQKQNRRQFPRWIETERLKVSQIVP
jgi:hypothetical protein